MVVAGYSVPPTDLLSQALVRISSSERTKSHKLSHLIVVNPSLESRAKLIGLVRSALDETSLVIELTSLKALAELLLQVTLLTMGGRATAEVRHFDRGRSEFARQQSPSVADFQSWPTPSRKKSEREVVSWLV